MKVAIKWILSTAILAILMYLLSMFILCKVSYKSLPLFYLIMGDYAAPNGGFTYQTSLDWRDEDVYDVVVLGASRAQRSYNTHFFDSVGVHLFNMGSPSQSLRNSRILLQNHIRENHVREVWLDVVPGLFVDNALESTSDLIQNWTTTSTALQMAWESGDTRCINLWMKRLFCENAPDNSGKGIYRGNGYVDVRASLRDDLMKKWKNKDYGKEQRGYVEFGEEAWKELEKIMIYCQAQHIQLRLVASPVSVFNNQHDQQAMNARLETMVMKYAIPFYDYSSRQEWKTTEHFYDEKHMNSAGVKLFNKDLVEKIYRNLKRS